MKTGRTPPSCCPFFPCKAVLHRFCSSGRLLWKLDGARLSNRTAPCLSQAHNSPPFFLPPRLENGHTQTSRATMFRCRDSWPHLKPQGELRELTGAGEGKVPDSVSLTKAGLRFLTQRPVQALRVFHPLAWCIEIQ